jgi:hypothetical protein
MDRKLDLYKLLIKQQKKEDGLSMDAFMDIISICFLIFMFIVFAVIAGIFIE